jgi:hypothetical protein
MNDELIILEINSLNFLFQKKKRGIFFHKINLDKIKIQVAIFSSTAVWTQSFALASQVLYHLSHMSSLFFSGHFWDSISLFVQTTLDCNAPILCFYCLEQQAPATMLSLFHWDGVFQIFLPGLASNHDPPDLSTHVGRIIDMSYQCLVKMSI